LKKHRLPMLLQAQHTITIFQSNISFMVVMCSNSLALLLTHYFINKTKWHKYIKRILESLNAKTLSLQQIAVKC